MARAPGSWCAHLVRGRVRSVGASIVKRRAEVREFGVARLRVDEDVVGVQVTVAEPDGVQMRPRLRRHGSAPRVQAALEHVRATGRGQGWSCRVVRATAGERVGSVSASGCCGLEAAPEVVAGSA